MYIISDFQKTSSDFNQVKNDTAVKVNLVPLLATQKSNVYVDSCWFESPIRQINQVEKLHVKIVNNSENVIENNAIKLYINNQQKTPSSFSVDKNSETEIILSFVSKESGIQHCKVQLNDYPVTFDDSFYFTFDVTKYITVLSVNSKDAEVNQAYLSKLFFTDSLFVYKSVTETQIDYSSLSLNHLIVLNDIKTVSSGLTQELVKFVERGGSVLVFPDKNADISSYNTFLSAFMMNTIEVLDTAKTKVEKINLEHPIYKDVFDKKTFTATNLDLPIVHRHYRLMNKSQSNAENILTLQNGSPFLTKQNYKKGSVYFCSISLDESFGNFSKHALFVPTLFKIALNSQTANSLYYTIGKDELIEFKNNGVTESVLKIVSVNNAIEVIPETKVAEYKIHMNVHNQVSQADNFNVKSGKDIIAGLSFNFNRLESDLRCLTESELMATIETASYLNYTVIENTEKSLKNIIAEYDYGTKLWKFCIILALLFIAIEILLLRYIKG
ncbi:MAG: hypothetical protein JNL69_05425 [Bacteroidia bacterium]|nr:hypothetical protein [Bacteroidia bacterium]